MMAFEQGGPNAINSSNASSDGWATRMTPIFEQPPVAPPENVDELFQTAFHLQQIGRLQEAAQLYEKVLRQEPRHADSLHLLGMILWAAKRTDQAKQFIFHAIEVNPRSAPYYSNLGTILQAEGHLLEAANCYRRALLFDPDLAEVHLNLGLLEQIQGELEMAITEFQRAAELKPELAEAWSNLGNALQVQGKTAEAELNFRKAVKLKPAFAEAWYNLGNVLQDREHLEEAAEAYIRAVTLKPGLEQAWSNLGNLRLKQNRLEEAEACQRRSIELNPDSADAHYNLGNVLAEQKQDEAAAAEFEEALRLNPKLAKARNNLGSTYRKLEQPAKAVEQFEQIPKGDPEFSGAYNNMGLALLSLGRHDDAETAIRETLALEPELAEAWCNLGVTFHAQNRLSEAMECYRKAQILKPDLSRVRMNIGLIELVEGDFENGWKHYEWRWENAPLVDRGFPQPQWRGEPLNGARILIHSEQGYGDTLQFCRYIPMVAAAGGTVIFETQERVVRLSKELEGVAEVIRMGDPLPEFDWHCPLLSLPTAFGTRIDTVPATTPYIKVPAAAQQKMTAVDWPKDKLKVGLLWAGNPSFLHDRFRFRSVPLTQFWPLFGVEGVQFYSLQVGQEMRQLLTAPGPMVDLAALTSDMADTGAAIERMDLVISVDTSVAHLAAGLNKPTWVLIPNCPDWRWLQDREDTPWYPTMQLFRQPEPGNWTPVIERIRQQLAARAAQLGGLHLGMDERESQHS
jgi:tetratricopeptide (TPR) repeat protein